MPNTYQVRFTYTLTRWNKKPISIGAYCGWLKYISTAINGTFPNASGPVQSSVYLAPFFYPNGPGNIGTIASFNGTPTLTVAGGVVTAFQGDSTFSALSLNINEVRFNFGNSTVPSVNGEGMVKFDKPVHI